GRATALERLRAPVRACDRVTALSKEDHVLAEAAARLEDRPLRGQRRLDQRGERRRLGDADQLIDVLAAPVLGPELLRRRPRVERQRHTSAPLPLPSPPKRGRGTHFPAGHCTTCYPSARSGPHFPRPR